MSTESDKKEKDLTTERNNDKKKERSTEIKFHFV